MCGIPAPGIHPVSDFTSDGSAKLSELTFNTFLNFFESSFWDALITIKKNLTGSFLFFFTRTSMANISCNEIEYLLRHFLIWIHERLLPLGMSLLEHDVYERS